MEPEATKKARIAVLHEEMNSIDFANRLYWKNKAPSREAKAEHQRRQDRLEEIRRELDELQGPLGRMCEEIDSCRDQAITLKTRSMSVMAMLRQQHLPNNRPSGGCRFSPNRNCRAGTISAARPIPVPSRRFHGAIEKTKPSPFAPAPAGP
jgi:hypothetical protein